MRTKSLIFALLIALLGTSCSSTKWMQGSWAGTGDQTDGQKWGIELTVNSDTDIQISYPSLSCGGTWKLMQKDKEAIQLKETISTGTMNCNQGVEIHASKLGDGKMKVLFYLRAYNAEKPVASAILSKK